MKMPDYKRIYNNQAVMYDELVAYEDYEGNILPTLMAIRPLTDLDVIELGAGTGRLTRLLAPHVRTIMACDNAPHMLGVAQTKLVAHSNWWPIAADNRGLPFAGDSADVVVSGWSLGHFTGWYPQTWQTEIKYSLDEMKRILRPGGVIIILETLGTGFTTPTPPTTTLAAYYNWLETVHSFKHRWIRTDYRFPSLGEAHRLVEFFFGHDLVEATHTPIVPECSGVWWYTL